eukprot:CAMPEP_0197686276 /NCGR_PEP_ID=MMETSP1338-20131121/102243_1 /TAXON_ID=43686 ORGANISM="Pelagodinium beii, Strain RCC1491" /NCGR_SAMPLE_ID=MMETSP1338 /ASSEMBLY_ACC=CAM_ASM_000754 /LENGTH=32 /DNA_ID= /DNA_START= /DNA_END= /DNA_ORIENTATION=
MTPQPFLEPLQTLRQLRKQSFLSSFGMQGLPH